MVILFQSGDFGCEVPIQRNSNWKKSFFKKETSQDELIWHLDKEDRKVELIEGTNWKLQLDNQLPQMLQLGKSYWIPKMTYHRLVKGDDDLSIRVWKY